MRLHLFLGTALAVLFALAAPAGADELEIAADTGYFNEGPGGLNTRFSGLPGLSLDYVADFGDHFYAEAWVRRSFADPKSESDAEIDFGVGVADLEVPGTCLSFGAYAGRWQYGEGLDIGDTAVQVEAACGDFHVAGLTLEGVTDAFVGSLSYDIALSDRLTLTPSVSRVDFRDDEAEDETNFGLSASYEFPSAWRFDAVAVWQEGQRSYVGARIARTFDFSF